MKKLVFNSILILFGATIFAQNGPPWKPEGNSASTGDFLGTTNSIDLPFKTNNTTRFTLNANGDIVFNSLANSFSNSFLSIDQNGKVFSLDQNSLGLFQRSGNDYYINSGNLGLGLIPNPSYKLDVLGNARISNNLYVGGGVVITNKVDASIEVKAGNILVSNDMDVAGNSRVAGTLTSPNGFMVDNSTGFKFTPGSTLGTGTFQLGKILPIAVPCAAQPQSGLNVSIGGNVQIYDPGNSINGGLLNLQTWTGGSSIDASTGGNTSASGLLLNYFCGNSTFINTGANGGTVYMGNSVSAAQNVGIGSNYPNPNYNANVGLNVFANNTNMDGIRLNIWNGTVKAINLVHPSTGISNFVVWQGGQTQIGYDKQVGGPHSDAMLTVGGLSGKIVAKSCYILLSNWADYVFDSNYKLPSWKETENYFTTNKHLKDVPTTKEIIENGVNLGETSVVFLKKLEEAYLYISEMKKEIDSLRNEVKLLKEKTKN